MSTPKTILATTISIAAASVIAGGLLAGGILSGPAHSADNVELVELKPVHKTV